MFVVLSGLPGSGKTNLARPLSKTLRLPLLDKDDLLETLLTNLGADSPQDRERLSRASDALMEKVAGASSGAVLSSFWRRESLSATSGTPTNWLRHLPGTVEVLCDCPPRIAAERFHARLRHPGHHDSSKSVADSLWRYEQLAATLPLGVGPLVSGRHLSQGRRSPRRGSGAGSGRLSAVPDAPRMLPFCVGSGYGIQAVPAFGPGVATDVLGDCRVGPPLG